MSPPFDETRDAANTRAAKPLGTEPTLAEKPLGTEPILAEKPLGTEPGTEPAPNQHRTGKATRHPTGGRSRRLDADGEDIVPAVGGAGDADALHG